MSETDDYLDAAPALPTLPGAHVRLTMADIHADGIDDGIAPDWQPAAGERVTLTPVGIKSNSLLVYDAAGSQPIVARVQPVHCMIGKHGWLVKKDTDGVEHPVWILATDDPLLSVTGWLWRATIAGSAFNFPAPTGGTVELADFIAAPALEPDVQTWVGRIPELIDAAGGLVSISSIAEDAGEVVVTLSNGSESRLPLPKGEKGDDGPPLTVAWEGTRLIVGDAAPVDLKGAPGDPGSPGAPGAVATASDYLLVGPGRPDVPATTGGIITGTEPVGCEYRSTDGAAVGAWVWRKRPTGWVVADGDTGWRRITTYAPVSSGQFQLRRLGDSVTFRAFGIATTGPGYFLSPDGSAAASQWPAGFSDGLAAHGAVQIPVLRDGSLVGSIERFWEGNSVRIIGTVGNRGAALASWITSNAWPTTLPGSPA